MVRFTTKRIDSMTLGERMKKARDEKRLTLGEISRNTNVQVKYLEFLEEGNYSKLPADVYVKGFLRNYASFMNISSEALLKSYERERQIEKNIRKDNVESKDIEPIKFSSFIITPKIIVIFLSAIFVLSGFVYLYKQVDNFVSVPRLVIVKPLDGENVEGRVVRVNGIAEKDAKVTVNGQSIIVNENGEFSEEIGLGEGLNTITVVAKNKFEKEASQTISVNAKYDNITESSSVGKIEEVMLSESDSFSLELKVGLNPTWISVEADGNLMYSGVLLPDSVQEFVAKEKISVTSGNGNDTYIKLKGGEEEVLSDKLDVVRDIIFTPNGRAEL